ncbi:MAG: ABC transporter permease [Acidobacteria bacterium]|nr:ABC transporter permease [Acidobacteriota bacterium]
MRLRQVGRLRIVVLNSHIVRFRHGGGTRLTAAPVSQSLARPIRGAPHSARAAARVCLTVAGGRVRRRRYGHDRNGYALRRLRRRRRRPAVRRAATRRRRHPWRSRHPNRRVTDAGDERARRGRQRGRAAGGGRQPLAAPGFFDTLQIPILHGRGIDERDPPDPPRVAVLSQTMARVLFGHDNAVGRHFRFEREPTT